MRHRFGSFVLVEDRLTAAGRGVHLAAKPLGVLRTLVSQPGETVGRDQLAVRVWGTDTVSDQSIARSVFLLRQALAEHDPVTARSIETVYGRGYRFVAPVIAEPEPPAAGAPAARTPALPGDPRRRAARDLCLQARAHLARGTPRLDEAMALFERAVATDPSYAPALAGLGECHVARAASSLEDSRVASERGRSLLRDAVRLAPDDARAQACLGLVYSVYDWDLPRAEHAFELAFARPSQEPMVHWFHARHLLSTGRFAAALAASDTAAALDPSQLAIVVHRTFAEYCAGRSEDALAHCRELVRLEPDHASPRLCLALMAADAATASEALAAIRPLAIDAHPQLRPILAYVHAAAGDRDAAARELAECERLRSLGRHVMPTILAQAALRLGDTAGALSWLDRAIEDRCPWVAYATVLPGLATLRSHPRFRAVARATGRDFLL